jgi:hypothetical protein
MTWVAYSIDGDRPMDIAHFQGELPGSNWSVQHRIAALVLQFVGTYAHELALSVGHWSHNSVVAAQFYLVEGRVMGDVGDIRMTDFFQDGENTVKAYNVRVNVVWVSRIDTGQGAMEDLVFEGEVV